MMRIAALAVLLLTSCHLTPAQQTALAQKVETIAFDLASCAVAGPAMTALETYLAHRIDADPAEVQADVQRQLSLGVGRDIACALKSIAGRRGQSGEVASASAGETVVIAPAALMASRAKSCAAFSCGQVEGRAAVILGALQRVQMVKGGPNTGG